MEKQSSRQWIEDLADGVSDNLNAAFPEGEQHPERAAIFVAVRTNRRGTKEVIYDVRGEGHPLAEAVGSLIYDRTMPPEIVTAAASAIIRRMKEGDAPPGIYGLNLPGVNLNEVKPDKKLLK